MSGQKAPSVSSLWVVMPDNGYEGLGEPIVAFHREDNAKAFVGKQFYGIFKICEVPIMWFVPAYIVPVDDLPGTSE